MNMDILYPTHPPSPPMLRAPAADNDAAAAAAAVVPGSHVVTVPNTRQKSCNACVAGKRRCDKKEPSCSRCLVKKSPCVYRRRVPARRDGSESDSDSGSTPASAGAGAGAAASVSPPVSAPVDVSATTVAPENTLLNHGHGAATPLNDGSNMLALRMHHQQHQQHSLFSAMDMPLDDMDVNASPSAFSHELSLIGASDSYHSSSSSSSSSSASSSSGSPPNSTLPFPAGLTFDENIIDFNMLDVYPNFTTLQAESDAWLSQCHDFPDLPALEARQMMLKAEPCEVAIEQANNCTTAVTFLKPGDIKDPRSKMGYMMQMIKEQPIIFGQTRATAFMNPELYRARQPRAITHAWTACTVYSARTPATQAWATRVIVEGSSALLRSPPLPIREDPNALLPNGKVNTHALLDRIAAVQAMLLYQIIKCYDGDQTLASQAERDSPVLLEWTQELITLRNMLEKDGFGGSVALMPGGQTITQRAPVAWEDWVLIESARRTILQAMCVVGTWECLQGRTPPCCMFEEVNGFTISSHLWNADNSNNFYYAWRNKPQYRVERMQLTDMVTLASPEDICDFGLVLLKTKLGVDAAEAFMLRGSFNNELY